VKANDILNLWATFDSMMKDPAFTNEQKLGMGREFISALPPEMMCTSSKLSRDAVLTAMQGRLHDTTRNSNLRTDRETGLCAGTPSLALPKGRNAGSTQGDGVSMADMAHPKKPKKQAKESKVF
jgi:hypothetical protein